MNIKVVNQQKDIVRVIINDPKTYNSLSTKNLNDDLTNLGDSKEASINLNKVF